jgi:hypothetical protein
VHTLEARITVSNLAVANFNVGVSPARCLRLLAFYCNDDSLFCAIGFLAQSIRGYDFSQLEAVAFFCRDCDRLVKFESYLAAFQCSYICGVTRLSICAPKRCQNLRDHRGASTIFARSRIGTLNTSRQLIYRLNLDAWLVFHVSSRGPTCVLQDKLSSLWNHHF